jgi:parallel beta-helix repeat protein
VTIQNAPANVVGGAGPGQRNVISGNLVDGVQVIGMGSAGASIVGNLIGLDASGKAKLPNLQDGVSVNSVVGATIGGLAPGDANVVSGNGGNGISVIGTGVTGTNASGIQILGNLIGTDSSGSSALGNAFDGIAIAGATGTLIAGSAAVPSVIAGNGRNGVEVTGGATGTIIQASLIGTNGLGTRLGNTLDGVKFDQSPFNLVGGTSSGDGNTIAFNKQDGIEVNGSSAMGIAVQGNLIRSNEVDGVRIKDASGVTVGNFAANTDDPAVALRARNVISGNSGAGIEILGLSTLTTVQGNLIGTDIFGTAARGNEIGVFLNDAVGNTIGGPTPEARNVISGNLTQGVQVFRVTPLGTGDVIEGNWIGIDVTGVNALGNGATGIGVFLNNAPNNTVGGSTASASNVISGNGQAGVTILGRSSTGNRIEGNVIGASPDGGLLRTTASSQFVGVLLQDAAGNTVGGADAESSNLIGENFIGVEIVGVTSSDVIANDRIGGNTFGVYLNGAAGSLIAFNSIVDNTDIGLSILGSLSTTNDVQGNAIQRNIFAGVYIEGASNNTIGTLAAKPGSKSGLGVPNNISRNGSVGVYLFGGATGNAFRRNTIQGNGLYGVLLYNSAGNVPGIPRTGPDANQIGGSGIASFREFTGPVTSPHMIIPLSKARGVKAAIKGGRQGGRS